MLPKRKKKELKKMNVRILVGGWKPYPLKTKSSDPTFVKTKQILYSTLAKHPQAYSAIKRMNQRGYGFHFDYYEKKRPSGFKDRGWGSTNMEDKMVSITLRKNPKKAVETILHEEYHTEQASTPKGRKKMKYERENKTYENRWFEIEASEYAYEKARPKKYKKVEERKRVREFMETTMDM